MWNALPVTPLYWLYLFLAILAEVLGTVSMKMADGFSRLVPSILVFVFYAASVALLTLALDKLELSVVYAIWGGVGTALTTLIGVFYFKEPMTALKLGCISLIVIGVVGLNFTPSSLH